MPPLACLEVERSPYTLTMQPLAADFDRPSAALPFAAQKSEVGLGTGPKPSLGSQGFMLAQPGA